MKGGGALETLLTKLKRSMSGDLDDGMMTAKVGYTCGILGIDCLLCVFFLFEERPLSFSGVWDGATACMGM